MKSVLPSLKPSKLDEQGMQDAAGEATFSYGLLHTNEKVLDDQLELIYNSSVRTQDVV